MTNPTNILGLFEPKDETFDLFFRNPKPLVSERVEITPEALIYLRRFDDSEGRQEVEYKIDLTYSPVTHRYPLAYAMLEDMKKVCAPDTFLVYVREAVKATTRTNGSAVLLLDYIFSNTVARN